MPLPPEPKLILPPDVVEPGAYLTMGTRAHDCKLPSRFRRWMDGAGNGAEWWCRGCDMCWVLERGEWTPLGTFTDRRNASISKGGSS